VGWLIRILVRRSITQHTILTAVLAVAVAGASLLGTFSLLLSATQQRALGASFERAPDASTTLAVELNVGQRTPGPSLDAARTFLDDLAAGVPTTRSEWLTSQLVRLPATTAVAAPVGYVASYPDLADNTVLRSGAFPTAATDAAGRVEVAVPAAAAKAFGWVVGSDVSLQALTAADRTRAVVVGVFDIAGTSTYWAPDMLRGTGANDQFRAYKSNTDTATTAYGPFVAAPETLLDAHVPLDAARIVLRPDLSSATPATLAAVRDRLPDASGSVPTPLQGLVEWAAFSSQLGTTIDSTTGQLAVTRIALIVVGLMLMVLALTVLLLAARLLAERRSGEQSLMSSRGASHRQLVRLAALEGLLIAAVTTAVAPWAARALLGLVTRQGVFQAAGLDRDPGLPTTLWLACAAAAVLFGAVLLTPLMRRGGSVVEVAQSHIRQDRRGVLTRSGIDLALVALAVVGYWQLREYRSPVLASGGTDLVLVTGPALFLLAGAVLVLRVLPLVARFAERLAARSRSLVLPMAAWEVGRRPARATGAVLLLTLALAVGTFSQSFLATWRTSQVDQADLQVGTDLRVTGDSMPLLEQSGAMTALGTSGGPAPVAWRATALGPAQGGGGRPTDNITLVALDTTRANELLRGRSPAGSGWAPILDRLSPSTPATGVTLPGTPNAIRLTVTLTVTPASSLHLPVDVIVQDANGARVALRLPTIDVTGNAVATDGKAREVVVPLTRKAGSALAAPISIVGFSMMVVAAPPSADAATGAFAELLSSPSYDATITLDRAAAVDGTVATPVDLRSDSWSARTLPWYDSTTPLAVKRGTASGSVTLTRPTSRNEIRDGQPGATMTTFDIPVAAHAIATDDLVTALGHVPGEQFMVDLFVDGAPVTTVIDGSVPSLPSVPTGLGIAMNRDLLTRMTLASGGFDPLADEWWMSTPDDQAATVATAARSSGGIAVSRAELRTDLTDGPLHIGLQAALWIVTAACLILAVAGFAMSATVSVRLRELEFARLQALGTTRSRLVRAVLAEHALLGVLGSAGGVALGALLGLLVGPLLTVAADGSSPTPPVLVRWPWTTEVPLLVTLTVLLTLVVTLTVGTRLRRTSSTLLRLGDDA